MSTTATVTESDLQEEECPMAKSSSRSGCPYAGHGRPEKIPGPTAYPLIGSIPHLDLKAPFSSFLAIQKQYGPIFQMVFAGKREISVCTRELANEVCDETKWHKLVSSGVSTLRQVVQDALFTAHHGSAQWAITHRILKPIFGPLSVRAMFDEMKDVAEQLCLKWARHGGDQRIDVAGDYTRLTLDTISLCMMDYRFNSFYRDGQHHPFVKHMVAILSEADIQAMLPDWAGYFRPRAMRKFRKDIQLMTELCRGMVEHRRAHPVARADFLNAMLQNRDPVTGEGLDDDEIVRNLITFLVAGHETTSGMLSFATYFLLAHPETLAKAQAEVDRVVGTAPVDVGHLQKLPYLDAVFREALRLMPTAVAFYVTPYKTEMLAGKYRVDPGEAVCLLLDPIHRDKAVYGADADAWKPERMLQDKFEALPPNAWKPFGNGQRICLGMAFTWQEAKLAMAMILQNFDLRMHDPAYQLRIKHLLTIKPEGFDICARLRRGRTATDLHKELRRGRADASAAEAMPTQMSSSPSSHQDAVLGASGRPLAILFGSDTGTCEALANRLASQAKKCGYTVSIRPMNAAVNQLPPLSVFICGTYHGKAAANAQAFMAWADAWQPGDLARQQKMQYAVLGCGHSDWASTFYMVPSLLDARLCAAGAARVVPMGRINNARDDPFDGLDRWAEGLWERLGALGPGQTATSGQDDKAEASLTITETPHGIPTLKEYPLPAGFSTAVVTKARTLAVSGNGTPEKGHIELALPSGLAYDAGYHVQVMPRNDDATVLCALSRFGLHGDSIVTTCQDGTRSTMKAAHLFAGRDLRRAVTRKSVLDRLVGLAADDATRNALEGMRQDLQDSCLELSLLAILKRFPSASLPITLARFVTMLPEMQPRTYSFSSSSAYLQATHPSPSTSPSSPQATLTFSIIDQTSSPTRGLCSNHLAALRPGDPLHVSIQKGQDRPGHPFRLPRDPCTPVVMVAAGTGLAPFLGFFQQRAVSRTAGEEDAGKMVLFFGCKAGADDLYRSELDAFERRGVVQVHRAYSRPLDGKGRYVQDLLREHACEVATLWAQGAVVLVCGAKKLADGVRDVLAPVLLEVEREEGRLGEDEARDARDAREWLEDGVGRGRYVAEVFT